MDEQMITKTFGVEGMACMHCKAAVEEALTALDGVRRATANVEDRQVQVEYNAACLTPQQLQQAVEAAGYDLLID